LYLAKIALLLRKTGERRKLRGEGGEGWEQGRGEENCDGDPLMC